MRFKFSNGPLGEVRFAAGIPVGTASCGGKSTAFAPEADIPALLREGALEALGAQVNFSCDVLSPRGQGVDIPLEVTRMGRCVSSVVVFGVGALKIGEGGPTFRLRILNGSPRINVQTYPRVVCMYALFMLGCIASNLLDLLGLQSRFIGDVMGSRLSDPENICL